MSCKTHLRAQAGACSDAVLVDMAALRAHAHLHCIFAALNQQNPEFPGSVLAPAMSIEKSVAGEHGEITPWYFFGSVESFYNSPAMTHFNEEINAAKRFTGHENNA